MPRGLSINLFVLFPIIQSSTVSVFHKTENERVSLLILLSIRAYCTIDLNWTWIPCTLTRRPINGNQIIAGISCYRSVENFYVLGNELGTFLQFIGPMVCQIWAAYSWKMISRILTRSCRYRSLEWRWLLIKSRSSALLSVSLQNDNFNV